MKTLKSYSAKISITAETNESDWTQWLVSLCSDKYNDLTESKTEEAFLCKMFQKFEFVFNFYFYFDKSSVRITNILL